MRKLVVIILSMLVISCAKEEVKPSVDDLFGPEISLEGGTWKTGCVIKSSIAQNLTASYNSSIYQHSGKIYSDIGCQTESLEIVEAGSYTIQGKSPGTSMIMLDRVISSMTLKPLSASIANTYNTNNHCGYSDWSVGVAKNVLGRTCSGVLIPSPGAVYYDLYSIARFDTSAIPGFPGTGSHRGDLNFGYTDSGKDGSTEDKRPTSVTSPAFRRQ